MKYRVLTNITKIIGIFILGCAGEFATYNLSKEGSYAFNTSEYHIALEKWQTGLKQARISENKHDISMFLYNIGLAYDKLSQYQEALDYYQQALEIRRELRDKRGVGNILNNIGIVYGKLSQYQEALQYYRLALEIKRKIHDKSGESSNLNNIGAVYWNLGQYNQALKYYDQALEIKLSMGDKHGEANTLNNIGGVYWNLGQYQQALDYYQQTLAIRRAIEDKPGQGSTLNNIGVVFWNFGQHQKALDYYQQALTIRRTINDKRGEGSNLNNIGVVSWKLGQYQEALKYLQQALVIRRVINDKRGEGSTLNNIGAVYESQRQYQDAFDHYRQALTIRRNIGDKRGEGFTLTKIGDVFHHLGQYQKAYNAFQTSIDINEALGSIDNLWMAQRGLAAIETQLDQSESAIVHYEQAIDNIEKLRAGLLEKEHKLSFMQDKLHVYDELVDLLRTLHQAHPNKGYDRKALEIFERKQGRLFLEEMGKSGARLFAGLPESIKQREDQWDTQLDQIRQNLTSERAKASPNRKRIQNLEHKKKTLQAERTALQARIKSEYPDYYALRYPQPAHLSDLQKTVLQPGELMMVYSVMKEYTVLWLISQENMRMFNLPVGQETLRKKIAEFRRTMWDGWVTTRGLISQTVVVKIKRKRIPFNQISHALYDLLIPEDVRSLLTDSYTLNVIPTGPLYALPFEALLTRAADESKTLHYLIEDIPINYLSSTSLLKTLREAKSRRASPAHFPVLAFAHPVYKAKSSENIDTVRELRSRSYQELLDKEFLELPETGKEAEAVAKLFEASDWGQTLISD